MRRTTVMAPEDLLDQLQSIADRENVSLAEVIRQGLRMRVEGANEPLAFIGVGCSTTPPHDMARRAGDMVFEPQSWR